MADIISRLRLDSTSFDSKIKRAGQELMAYSEHCQKVGLAMGYANKDAQDFAKSLGNMGTTSKTARGKVNELSDAFINLKVMYKNMTDEEKNNTFGKNLAASLEHLKVRIKDTKSELASVKAELDESNGNSISDLLGNKLGSGMSSLFKGDMGGALSVLSGNLMTKGVIVAGEFVNKLQEVVTESINIAREGEGIRIAFERLNRPELLDELNKATHNTVSNLELMKQAVKFNDFNLNLDQMGTLLAFAQQKAKDTGQSVDYMVDSIVTGLGRQSLMILDNLGLSAAEIKDKMKDTGDMTTAVAEIIRTQMENAGEYTETAADRAAQSAKNTEDAMYELGQTLLPLQEIGKGMWNTLEVEGLKFLNNGLKVIVPKVIAFKETISDIYDSISNSSAWNVYIRALKKVSSIAIETTTSLGRVYKIIKDIFSIGGNSGNNSGNNNRNNTVYEGGTLGEVTVTGKRKKGKGGGGRGGGVGRGSVGGNNNTYIPVEGSIDWQTAKVQELQKKYRAAADDDSRKKIKAELDAASKVLSEMTAKTKAVSTESLTELQLLQDALKTVQNSMSGYGKATDEWKTMNEEAERLQKQIDKLNGTPLKLVETSSTGQLAVLYDQLQTIQNSKQNAATYEDYQAMSEEERSIQKQIDEIESPKEVKLSETLSDISSGMGNMVSGIESLGIKVPNSMKKVISVMQGISSILTGISSIVSAIQVITTAQIFKLSNGGVVRAAVGVSVPGNSYSGDLVPALLNSGETVLNRAQVGNLSSQLNSPRGIMAAQPFVEGDKIFLGINNSLSHSGQGEIVTTSMLRQLGVI